MPDDLRISGALTIPAQEIVVRVSRSSGPGGQHANVTASRVEVAFDVRASTTLSAAQRARLLERVGPVVRAVAQDARSQARNRELALERLAARIAAGLHVPRSRTPTRPTKASKRRRVEAKARRGEIKRGRSRPSQDD